MKAFIVRTLLIIVSIILVIQLWIFSSLVWWRTYSVDTTMLMRWTYWTDSSKPIQHQWRDYDQISDNLKHAIVAAEDAKFTQHQGFDIEGIKHALERNRENEHVVAGGSTISQQLSKNLFLFNKRSFLRKGQEAVATVMMERMWSKQRILEVYMNSVEFGDHIFGVEAASKHYFGKTAQKLSRDEAAFLAAILPNPKYYQNNRNDRRVVNKKRTVLRYMRSTQVP